MSVGKESSRVEIYDFDKKTIYYLIEMKLYF